MKKFAVILSGCGVFDGAEIHEAILSLWAIKKLGGSYEIFAPDKDQYHVINHLNGEVMAENRNVLVESARIARGQIKPLAEYVAEDFDALLMPGGFGAAKNLSTFAFEGSEMTVDLEVEKALRQTYAAKKPIGALCISPIILSKIFQGARITLGEDAEAAAASRAMGAEYVITNHAEVIIDKRYALFTTPCYMLDADILQIAEGAENIVMAMMEAME